MDKPREIIRAVTRLGRGRRIGATLAAFAGVVAVVAASLLFAFGVSALWGWGPAAGLALVAAAGALYGFWRLIGRGLAARARLADAVDSAEARVPTLRRRLASAYYVAAAKEGRGTSPALAEAFVDDVERRLPPRMTAPLPRRYRLVPLGLLSGAAAAWLLVAFAAPGFLGDRLGALAEAAPAGGLIVRVTPGDTRVGVGAELTVEAELRRDFAGEAAVVVERGGVRDEVPLEARGPRELAAKVDAGAEGFRYYVVAGGEKSRRYKVEVVPPPSIGALRVTVTPPAYAGLPARALPPGEGDVRALAGASVRVEVGVEGADVVEIESPGGRVNCEREGDAFAGAFVVTEGGTYRVKAASPWGEAFTPRFGVVVDPDAPPEVTVLEPGRDLLIADTSRSPRLRFSCADDFGLGAVRVVYYNEVTGQRFTGEVGGGAGRRELEGDADLIPPGMDLFPGDVISYYVEAFDNDTVRGPKVGRSATYRFRFPTAAEMFEQVNDEMTEGVSDLAGLREQTRRLREQLEKAGASSKQDDAISRPELRELVAEQERLRRELGEAAQKLEALLERGEDNAISPELAAKVLEANRLLNEALDEQSREALEKLSDALREVDPERVRELMEQVRLDQAEMERNLERVINILKDAQREEMLRNLAACAEELADRQQDVLERLESANAAREQRDLARDVEEFGSDVRESAATFDEVDPELAAELRKLAEEYAKGQAKRDAERAADDLAAGEMEEAAAGGAAAEKELEELAAALREMSKRYREGKRRALLSDLDRAIERVLGASHRTESMAAEAAGGKAGPAYGERQESLAAEVGNISEDARAAAEKSLLVPLAVSEALADIGAELEAGARNAALGNGEAAVQANVRALASLNVVAAALLEVRSNVASAGSSMGLAEMIEQMKKLAEGQRQVNGEGKATFSMMPGMSPSQLRQALERLAAEQAMLREGMEKLSREGRGRGGEEAGDPGGLAKEMEELERELKAGNLDERVIEKQEKLLERMLSSTRALRVQGRSSRRRAEPAKEYATPTVAPLPGTLTAPRLEAGPASGPPAAGYVPADLRASLAEYYRRMAGGE
jgi:uncharacterized membrane-anchored protein YjiN (DUF445 family)